MSNIKVSELFYSVQGEGRYVGVPSIFLRTFGCNFTCAGFGMPKGEKSQEADRVAELLDTRQFLYNELPLVSTGCDSYAAWHPKFKHLSPTMSSDSIAESILALLPNQEWYDSHLVITGGEPLLGWQRAYPDLLNHPKMKELKELTFETNGTQPLTQEFRDYLRTWGSVNRQFGSITFSVSPKLSCSGESSCKAIRPDIVCSYEDYGYTYLKFVIATEDDAEEALEVIDLYRADGFNGPVYLMPVGGTNDTYFLNNKTVSALAMKHGLRFSPRLQVDLFGNQWAT